MQSNALVLSSSERATSQAVSPSLLAVVMFAPSFNSSLITSAAGVSCQGSLDPGR